MMIRASQFMARIGRAGKRDHAMTDTMTGTMTRTPAADAAAFPGAPTYRLLGCILSFRLTHAETVTPAGGGYSMVEALVAPGAGAPPNRHPGDAEAFRVLEGEFEFRVGEAVRRAGPGDLVKVPAGEVHAFANVGAAPGRLIILNSPGLVHEAFFSRCGERVAEGCADFGPAAAPDLPRLLAEAAACGLEILPPPGASAA